MRFEKRITVVLDQTDAAIAAVLLAENAGREALKALLADRTTEIGGTTNRRLRAVADSYIKVGNALTFAIMSAMENRGLESTSTLHRSVALAGVAAKAAAEVAAEVGTETEDDE